MAALLIFLPSLTLLVAALSLWAFLRNPGDWLGLRQNVARQTRTEIARDLNKAVELPNLSEEEKLKLMAVMHQRLSVSKFFDSKDFTGLFELEEYQIIYDEIRIELLRRVAALPVDDPESKAVVKLLASKS